MALFDENIDSLNEYRNHPRIKDATEGFVMLTRKEFTDWFKPTERTRSKSKKTMKASNTQLITELLVNVCRNSIGTKYLKSTVGHLVPYRSKGEILPDSMFDPLTQEIREMYFDARHDHKFDLLVCVKEDIYEATKPTQDEKTDAVVSFIVSELGECKRKPNTMSVNLICSRRIEGFKANFLLAAMMYCVKSSKYDKEVILELAGKFSGNIGGFKSYSRVGFDRDSSLFGNRCFDDIDNLPMSVNLNKLEKEQIIAYVVENRSAGEIFDDLGKHFYLLPQLEEKLSRKLGRIADYYHELDVDEEPTEILYKNIVKGAKKKSTKKRKLLKYIESHTPKNTPVRKTSKKKRKAEENVTDTVERANKVLSQSQSGLQLPSRRSPTRSSKKIRSSKPQQQRGHSRGRVGSRMDTDMNIDMNMDA